MTKKPASLTSQLLVRKGDASPAAVPDAEPIEPTANAAPADDTENSASVSPAAAQATPAITQVPDPVFAATPNGMQPAQEPAEEQDPIRPEPEIVMEPAPEKKPSNTKAYVGGFIAIIVGVLVALNFFGTDGSGKSVAPLATKPDSNDTLGYESKTDTADAGPAKTLTPYTDAALGKVDAKIEPNDPAIDDAVKALALRPSSTPAAQPELQTSPASSIAPVTYNEGAIKTKPKVVVASKPVAKAATPAPTPTPVKIAKVEPPKVAPKSATVTTPAANVAVAQKGQYLIQLFSVRSQKDAQRGWAKAQSKHKALLSSETLNLEKADLGERGTYYRVRFGAYDTSAAANSVCSALKKAKQDCLVKKLR